MCAEWGIPHSHFLGGPLRWSDLDRAKALTFRALQAEACPNCGTRHAEWDPKEGGDRDAWVADITRPCEGCIRLAEAQEAIGDDGAKRGMRAFLTRPELVED